MTAKAKPPRVSVSLPRELWERVKVAAERTRRSAAGMLEVALERGLAEVESDAGIRPLQDGDRPNG